MLLALVQSSAISIFLESLQGVGGQLAVADPGWAFRFITVLTLTSGTVFVMWLGEQITERGIGNGISLIITIGIIARYPIDLLNTYRAVSIGQMSPFKLLILVAIMVAVVAGIIFVTQGQRRIPVQYAKRVVGRKIYGGQASHIPLGVNIAGVIPKDARGPVPLQEPPRRTDRRLPLGAPAVTARREGPTPPSAAGRGARSPSPRTVPARRVPAVETRQCSTPAR